MDVVVTGIGLISCLGSLQKTWLDILQNKSGIKLQHLFPELPSYPLGLIDSRPSKIEDLTQKLLVATLTDARLQAPLTECGVAIGSSRGCQASWEKIAIKKDSNNSIPNWLDTLPDRPATITAKYLQTNAPVSSPTAACATGIWALFKGYELIKTGRCERVIVGAVEAPISPLTLAAFERMGALARSGCYPFDYKREGLVLGKAEQCLF